MELYLYFLRVVLLLFLVYIFLCIVKWFKKREIINKIPGPHSYYIIGNVLEAWGSPEAVFKNAHRILGAYKICRIWLGPVAWVNLMNPEDIEVVISSTDNMAKSQLYLPLLPWLNTGLLTSSGKKWHARRKMLTQAFHFNILRQFVDVFARKTQDLIDKFDEQCNSPFVDIVPMITTFTLHSICETSMGTSLDENDAKQMEYKRSVYEMGLLAFYRILRPWLYPNVVFSLTPAFWKQRALVNVLHKFSLGVIRQRKENFSESITNKLDDVEFTSKKRLAMLDLLLSAKKDGFNITDDGIREEVDTFMFEGHDTTAMSICFTLLLLANNADAQQKVYEELTEAFGNSTKPPTYDDLQNLRYLELCIKESLRLYPSVPLISRIASKDITTFTGYKIPKDTIVHVHIYDLHHSADVYPNPEKFDPDRFLPENTAKRHPFAYLPFSGGPRNCIGQKFALLESKTVISGILRKYRLSPIDTPEGITVFQDLVIRPKDGIKIKFIARNRR